VAAVEEAVVAGAVAATLAVAVVSLEAVPITRTVSQRERERSPLTLEQRMF